MRNANGGERGGGIPPVHYAENMQNIMKLKNMYFGFF